MLPTYNNTLTFKVRYSPGNGTRGPFYVYCTVAGYQVEFFYLTTCGNVVNSRHLPNDEIWFTSLEEVRRAVAVHNHAVIV